MSAREIGEGTWTLISVRRTTVEQLRATAGHGVGYDEAIASLASSTRPQIQVHPARLILHLGSWTWMPACGRCGWYKKVRGRRETAQDELAEHVKSCSL